MINEYIGYYKSPVGFLKIIADNEAILSCNFTDEKEDDINKNEIINKAILELNEYFQGKRKGFDVKLKYNGTDFQKKVWKELQNIPYGTVNSYKDIAVKIKNEKAMRAVGNANNKNEIAIFIPCHRVIGKNGKLTGYRGGLDKKEWLLEHEFKFK